MTHHDFEYPPGEGIDSDDLFDVFLPADNNLDMAMEQWDQVIWSALPPPPDAFSPLGGASPSSDALEPYGTLVPDHTLAQPWDLYAVPAAQSWIHNVTPDSSPSTLANDMLQPGGTMPYAIPSAPAEIHHPLPRRTLSTGRRGIYPVDGHALSLRLGQAHALTPHSPYLQLPLPQPQLWVQSTPVPALGESWFPPGSVHGSPGSQDSFSNSRSSPVGMSTPMQSGPWELEQGLQEMQARLQELQQPNRQEQWSEPQTPQQHQHQWQMLSPPHQAPHNLQSVEHAPRTQSTPAAAAPVTGGMFMLLDVGLPGAAAELKKISGRKRAGRRKKVGGEVREGVGNGGLGKGKRGRRPVTV